MAIPLLRQALHQVTDMRLQQEIVHRLLRALTRLGRLDEAWADIDRATKAWDGDTPDWMASMAWRINPHWWEPCRRGRIQIRRASGTDAPWLKAVFAEGHFGAAVNREYSARLLATSTPQLAEQLDKQLAQAPSDLGAMLMVVEHTQREGVEARLGIASLVDIDAANRRAEFIIGFPGAVPHGTLVFEAGALLADLAFKRLQFHKVTASIYGDNRRLVDLAAMLQRVGFRQEGLQCEHVRLPSGVYVDIHLWGGLRDAVLQSPLMQRFSQRFS
jgi:RimJ/RimL family protein N-acetyltransferase